MRTAVVTVSDKIFRKENPDTGGPLLKEQLEDIGVNVVETADVPYNHAVIATLLIATSEVTDCELIITSGGIRTSDCDSAPEATDQVITRSLPGLEETIRREAAKVSPLAVLSRGVAGLRGRALIVNLTSNIERMIASFSGIKPALVQLQKQYGCEKTPQSQTFNCEPEEVFAAEVAQEKSFSG